MSIYTRWGGEGEIVANLGPHKPPYFEHEATLVLISHSEFGGYKACRFYWAEFLRTDPDGDGWSEINKLVESAPKLMLSAFILACAFKEAE